MSPRGALGALALMSCLSGLYGCGNRSEPHIQMAVVRSSPGSEAIAAEVAAVLDDLESTSMGSSATECEQGLAAVASGTKPVDTSLEHACELAIAGAIEPALSHLELQFRSLVDSELTLILALEHAARGNRQAFLELALQLEQRAGDTNVPFTALDADLFNAARAAAFRAVNAGVAEAETALERLEAREFPLFGVREEPLWRALYFRKFAQIQDTIATRLRVAAMANTLATLCMQWEPPGIRSVGFDTGLETYLAPVRARVPGRLLDAVPKVGKSIATAVGNATNGAGHWTLAGGIEEAVRVYQDVKRDVHSALAVGSVVGRDAAQAMFEAAPGCRSPRGLKFIDSLTRYFAYVRDSRPADAPSDQRSVHVEGQQNTARREP